LTTDDVVVKAVAVYYALVGVAFVVLAYLAAASSTNSIPFSALPATSAVLPFGTFGFTLGVLLGLPLVFLAMVSFALAYGLYSGSLWAYHSALLLNTLALVIGGLLLVAYQSIQSIPLLGPLIPSLGIAPYAGLALNAAVILALYARRESFL
jgi:hypothetical protein